MFFLETVEPHRNRKLNNRNTVLLEGKNPKTASRNFFCLWSISLVLVILLFSLRATQFNLEYQAHIHWFSLRLGHSPLKSPWNWRFIVGSSCFEISWESGDSLCWNIAKTSLPPFDKYIKSWFVLFKGTLFLKETEPIFKTLPDLVRHYLTHPLPTCPKMLTLPYSWDGDINW